MIPVKTPAGGSFAMKPSVPHLFDEEREEVLATAVRSVLLIGLPSAAISD